MAWDREKRGIFQRKQEKPQIKKHKPLKSEGNNGDITIRQLSDGVFLFFKALGKWYKTLNTSSQVIPEPDAPSSFSLGAPSQPIQSMVISENSLHIGNTKSEQGKISLSSDKTDLVFKNKAGSERKVVGKKASSTAGDTNAEHTITLGDETGSSTFGQLYLGAGSSYLGGVISGSANVTFLTQTAYLGARFMASHGVAGGAKGLSVVGTASADEASLYLAVHNVGVGGHIGLRETANDPTAVNDYGLIYVDSDDHLLYYRHNELSSGARIDLSSYAGMILGYRDIGLNEAAATYNLTTSYEVPTDEFGVTFIAPLSGNVEIYIQIQCDMGGSNVGDLYAGLSTQNNTNGYLRLAAYHEVELFDGMSRGAVRTITHSWTLPGLTEGSSYTYYVGFKSTSTTGTPHLQWGGNATDTTPDFIMKAIALPATIST